MCIRDRLFLELHLIGDRDQQTVRAVDVAFDADRQLRLMPLMARSAKTTEQHKKELIAETAVSCVGGAGA